MPVESKMMHTRIMQFVPADGWFVEIRRVDTENGTVDGSGISYETQRLPVAFWVLCELDGNQWVDSATLGHGSPVVIAPDLVSYRYNGEVTEWTFVRYIHRTDMVWGKV